MKAEMPEHTRGGGDGIAAAVGGTARQASTAQDEVRNGGTSALMEEVLRRENLVKAYTRVVQNKGAPGTDGMTVGQLKGYLATQWPRVRETLLKGEYVPQLVRRVEIPKPGGGVRSLGTEPLAGKCDPSSLTHLLC